MHLYKAPHSGAPALPKISCRSVGLYTLPAALQAAWFWDGAVVFAGEVPRIYMGSQPCLLKGTTLPTTRCTPTFGARS